MIKDLNDIARNAKKEKLENLDKIYNSDDLYYLITSRCIREAEKGNNNAICIDTIRGLENTYSVNYFLKYVNKEFKNKLKEEYGIKFREIKSDNPIAKDFKFIEFYW